MKKIIEKKKQKLTYLQWVDAHSSTGWQTQKELLETINNEMCIVEEVGWVVYEDKKEIHMVSRRLYWDANKTTAEYGLYQRIPKTWIMKRNYINI